MATGKKSASTGKKTKTSGAAATSSKAAKTAKVSRLAKAAKSAPDSSAAAQKAASPGAKRTKMPVKEQRELRAALMGLKERLVEQIATLQSDSLARHEPINPEEDGTVAFDRQFALNLVSTERESLFEIDDALQRIDAQTYGACEECGELIGRSRLKALPFVRMCVGCQSAKEKGKVKFTPMFG